MPAPVRRLGIVAGLTAALAVAALLPAAASAGTTGPPRIEGGFGFPTANRTAIRIAVDPRGARSLRNVIAVICYRGDCRFGIRLTSLGFFSASFAVTPRVGARVPIVAVACSRIGCTRSARQVLVSQSPSG